MSKTVAILGATSHIAKSIIFESKCYSKIYLFARAPQRVTQFLINHSIDNCEYEVRDISEFDKKDLCVDAIINCVGFGKPEKIRNGGFEIFRTIEEYDNRIIDMMLSGKTGAKYISCSSGAVYGTDHIVPCNEQSTTSLTVNSLSSKDAYMLSKIYSEVKHRSLADLNIIDIRLFSFFSQFIDLDSHYLITELITAVKNQSVFYTEPTDIIRDYVAPSDLAKFIELCIVKESYNGALDLYSSEPIKKSEIVSYFCDEYKMQMRYESENNKISPTGIKSIYYSINSSAKTIIGYKPSCSSLEVIKKYTKLFLSGSKALC
ncbi:MAG: NAD(P)-dependent oxidoreductase [Chitinispirillaceae bacterium]|nr:NAD(P)-dependent oxidoreductase [Chitinispirillaceae bacterium]